MQISKYQFRVDKHHVDDVVHWMNENSSFSSPDWLTKLAVWNLEPSDTILHTRIMIALHVAKHKGITVYFNFCEFEQKLHNFKDYYNCGQPLHFLVQRHKYILADDKDTVYLSEDELESLMGLKDNILWPRNLEDVMNELVAEVEALEQQCL